MCDEKWLLTTVTYYRIGTGPSSPAELWCSIVVKECVLEWWGHPGCHTCTVGLNPTQYIGICLWITFCRTQALRIQCFSYTGEMVKPKYLDANYVYNVCTQCTHTTQCIKSTLETWFQLSMSFTL